MPATSARQQRYMAMCSHSPSKARGKCPPHKVAQEFSHKPPGGYRKKKRREPFPRKNAAGYY